MHLVRDQVLNQRHFLVHLSKIHLNLVDLLNVKRTQDCLAKTGRISMSVSMTKLMIII